MGVGFVYRPCSRGSPARHRRMATAESCRTLAGQMGLEKHGCYSYPLAAPLQVADRQENAGTERVAAPALVPDCSEFSRVPEQGLRQACSISLLAEDIR